MKETCSEYVGVACVNGTCPKANIEEYEERGMDIVKNCKDCWYNKGCKDCALAGTEYCDKDQTGGTEDGKQ